MILKDLTVFLITTGENPNYDLCMESLKKQTVDFSINIIYGIAPMSKAFQEMILRCNTKYYIQVDDDMILYSNAVEIMYNTIVKTLDNVCMACFLLYDCHTEMNLYGVKIYKMDIMKNYPYNCNTLSCEKEQLDRLLNDGYNIVCEQTVLGKHSPHWTYETVFDRYYDLVDKYKKYKYSWIPEAYDRIYRRYQVTNDIIDFYALRGYEMSEVTSAIRNREKSFIIKDPNFIKLRSSQSHPVNATLFITSECNFKCKFCIRQKDPSIINSLISINMDVVKYTVNKFPTISGFCLCGLGEPLLYDKLPEIIEYLKSNNKFINIVTNGSLITKRWEWFVNPPSSFMVTVSLNAGTPGLHYSNTGIDGMFYIVIDGIKYLVNRGINTYLSFVCNKTSVKELDQFLKLAESLGVSGVYLNNLLPHTLKTEQDKTEFLDNVLTTEDFWVISFLKNHPCSSLIKSYPILIDLDIERRRCEFIYNSIAVDGNGFVSICNSIYPPSPLFGSIYEDNIWMRDNIMKFRLQFSEEQIPQECRYCFRNYQ